VPAPQVIPQRYEEHVPLDRLTPHPANPNQGDLGLLSELIEANGFAGAVLVQASTGIIIDGEHRYRAALEEGMTGLPVLWLDVTNDERDRLLASLNESTRRGRNDEAKLIALLTGLAQTPRGLEGTAYDGDDLDAMIAALQGDQGGGGNNLNGDPDDIPDPPPEPVTKPGDLWLLGGQHRLLCGDSTDIAAVEAMLAGDRADAMWTDPPYGVNYTGKTKDAMKIRNDGSDGLPALLAGAYAVATAALKPGAPVYIAHPAGTLSKVFTDAFFTAGWRFHEGLVWVKDSMVLGHSDYHYRHEPIMYGYTAGEGRHGCGGDGWYGDNSQTSVFEIPRPKRSEEHPTMKPVELVTRCLANSCPPGGLVYEPFCGSGTTLIAAHSLSQRTAAVEIDPKYCDVIIQRWIDRTGLAAHRDDGMPWPGQATADG
jgi:DNA modification methylase